MVQHGKWQVYICRTVGTLTYVNTVRKRNGISLPLKISKKKKKNMEKNFI